jgi:FixJ family two-component response regulator
MCEAMDFDLFVCGSVANFISITSLVRPACLACDLMTLQNSGFDLKAELQHRRWTLPVLFLSDLRDIDVATDVTGRGGWTLIRKPIDVDRVRSLFITATATDRRNVELELLRSATETVLTSLTERQRGVLGCVVEGMPTRMIARQFGVSTRLIELERSELLRAFGVPTTPDLMLKMGEYRVLDKILLRGDQAHIGLRSPTSMPRLSPSHGD